MSAVLARVRYCPTGAPTRDGTRRFDELPRRGESVLGPEDRVRYVVVEVEWGHEGEPLLILHSSGSPSAQRARS